MAVPIEEVGFRLSIHVRARRDQDPLVWAQALTLYLKSDLAAKVPDATIEISIGQTEIRYGKEI